MNTEELIFMANRNKIREIKNIEPLNFEVEVDDEYVDAPTLLIHSRVDGKLVLGRSEGITMMTFVQNNWEAIIPYINQAMDNWFFMYGAMRSNETLKKERASFAANEDRIMFNIGIMLREQYNITSPVHLTIYTIE